MARKNRTSLNLFSYKTPNIVIVGDKEMKRKIPYIEKNFNISLKFVEPDSLEENIDNKTIAVIIDEKRAKSKLRVYLTKVLRKHKAFPIFYLSRSLKRPTFYKEFYEKGLQGVVNWPEESKILHDLIIESLKPHPNTSGETKGDKKLAKVIKSHLILHGNYKTIKVKVIEGFVFLKGSVKSLYDKKVLEKESSKVLGVKEVVVKDVKIKKYATVTDKELERRIKMYTGNILGNKKRSIIIKVKNKVVTLSGAASSHGDILDVEKFAMKQQGVMGIKRSIKYKPALASKNNKTAKQLEKKIKNLFDGVKHISISIYGEYAEVSGIVKIKQDKILVEKYLLQVLPIKKVINKIFVTKKP